MSTLYLFSLCFGWKVARLVEVPYWWIPGWVYRWRLLDSMLYSTQGSILASLVALEQGWAINLSGGFHHASFDRGGGSCIYPDISLIVHFLESRAGMKRIMIIDLDAHQGNGFEKDLIHNDDVYIIDCYNNQIYPSDT